MRYAGFLAMTQKEVTRFLRIWSQTLIPPIITSTLFILVFGFSLGSRIDSIGGTSYLDFIIPGLVMMGVIGSSYSQTSFSLFIQKFHGSIQEVLLAPISYWQIIFSLAVSGIFRGLIVGLGILLVSMLFTSVVVYSWLVLLMFLILVSLLFSLAGILTALWATNFDQMSVFSTFIITPLTYLGGVFYSISMLPSFWGQVARFNPILYMVDGFRYGFLGVSDISVWHSFLLILGIVVVLFFICVYLFRTGYKLRN